MYEETSMSGRFLDLIKEEYAVLDGAFGTILQERGLTPQELPEEWNLLKPDIIREIHLDYFNSGAQIITTNTFGASPLKMGMRGKESLVKEVNMSGIRLAREALELFADTEGFSTEERNEKNFIAGSVGPSGKLLGLELKRDEVERSIRTQGEILAHEGVDLFIVETMMDLNEAELAVQLLKRENELPVVASMVFNKTKKGEYKTLFGNAVSESVNRLVDAGVDAVGTNCGLIEEYIEVIAKMRKLTQIPLIIYPNAGLPKLRKGVTIFDYSPENMIAHLDATISAGATVIGGCCGTTPEYIKLIADRIKGRKRPQ
jgi:5-methyltetrahydrofolate--homocysteine methyltransferase